MKFLILLILIFTSCKSTFTESKKDFYTNKLTSNVWSLKKDQQEHSLDPVEKSYKTNEKQIYRHRPQKVLVDRKRNHAYIITPGSQSSPSETIIKVDLENKKIINHITVGRRPINGIMHPSNNFLFIINQYSNFISILNLQNGKVKNVIIDYYCSDIKFNSKGDRGWISITYLDQVLPIYIDLNTMDVTAPPLGGLSFDFFTQNKNGEFSIYDQLKSNCQSCHMHNSGDFLVNDSAFETFISSSKFTTPGLPEKSQLLLAITNIEDGGYADSSAGNYHVADITFKKNQNFIKRLKSWIEKSKNGPGISVSNTQSQPTHLALTKSNRLLFVANRGTNDVSVIDTVKNEEITALYIQNQPLSLNIFEKNSESFLVISTLGVGFGTAKTRDPLGGESTDPNNEATQRSVLRDFNTSESLKFTKQNILGKYDLVDNTWNIKMRDIQNDLIVFKINEQEILNNSTKSKYYKNFNDYRIDKDWIRFTSDTAEVLAGDIKGDIPPILQKVVGSFPIYTKVINDHLYVSMAGSFEIVKWKLNRSGTIENIIDPIQDFSTGLRPMIFDYYYKDGDLILIVPNQLSDSISFINTNTSTNSVLNFYVDKPLKNDSEKGELIVSSSIFTTDGDTSCTHCHINNTGDGRSWGAAETVGQNKYGYLTAGGTLGIPMMRNIFPIQPYYFEGTHDLSEGQAADVQEPAALIDFSKPIFFGDFTKINSKFTQKDKIRLLTHKHVDIKERIKTSQITTDYIDYEYRRTKFFEQQSKKYFGFQYNDEDLFRFVGSWLGEENHLQPNPFDQTSLSVQRGKNIFNSQRTMCSVCHSLPEFTNKTSLLANNDRRALPQLISTTKRDMSYTIFSVNAMKEVNKTAGIEKGRIEKEESTFTTMQLRNIFDRPPVFLHHGRARSLREAILTPGHPGLQKFKYSPVAGNESMRINNQEIGFNETNTSVIDTHGGTSHLSISEANDLINFLMAIE